MALELLAARGGTRLRVKVQPGAGKNALAGEWNGALRVKVQPRPEQGEATLACLRLVAETLDVPRAAVTLVQGQTARLKVLHVEGLTPAEVQARLAIAAVK